MEKNVFTDITNFTGMLAYMEAAEYQRIPNWKKLITLKFIVSIFFLQIKSNVYDEFLFLWSPREYMVFFFIFWVITQSLSSFAARFFQLFCISNSINLRVLSQEVSCVLIQLFCFFVKYLFSCKTISPFMLENHVFIA